MLAVNNSCREQIMGSIYLSTVLNLWLQRCQTRNLIITRLKWKRTVKTLILIYASKEDIYHTIEAFLEEAEIGYKLCGDEVESVRPYSEIDKKEILYHKSQEE